MSIYDSLSDIFDGIIDDTELNCVSNNIENGTIDMNNKHIDNQILPYTNCPTQQDVVPITDMYDNSEIDNIKYIAELSNENRNISEIKNKVIYAQVNDSMQITGQSTDNSSNNSSNNIESQEVIQIKNAEELKVEKEYKEYIKRNNLLDEGFRKSSCKIDISNIDSKLKFSTPSGTTFTLEGHLSNICFNEEDLIKVIEANDKIIGIQCNFGEKYHESYVEPVIIKTTNRGRKKAPKKKKNRKRQGNGKYFNSCITCIAKSSVIPDKLYKFKVFRTGTIQLPGANQDTLDDVIEKISDIVNLFNQYLHNGEKVSEFISLHASMKNYKFMAHLKDNELINLERLKQIFTSEKREDVPKLFDIKYTLEDTKLSVRFQTPIPKKKDKRIRVNIFMKGKINILGGADINQTIDVCKYIIQLFNENYTESAIYNPNSLIGIELTPSILENNILIEESFDTLFEEAYFTKYPIANIKNISNTDVTDIISFIGKL